MPQFSCGKPSCTAVLFVAPATARIQEPLWHEQHDVPVTLAPATHDAGGPH